MIIKKISPLRFSLLITLFELFALFWIALLNVDNMTQGILWKKFFFGILVGILTTIPALIIFNYSRMNFTLNKKRITKIAIISFSILNAIFLALLFSIESLLTYFKNLHIALNALVGFTTIFIILLLLLPLYNHQPINITLNKKKIEKISVLQATIFVAIMEAIILPLLVFFSTVSQEIWWMSLSGAIAGFVGTYITVSIYNRLTYRITLTSL